MKNKNRLLIPLVVFSIAALGLAGQAHAGVSFGGSTPILVASAGSTATTKGPKLPTAPSVPSSGAETKGPDRPTPTPPAIPSSGAETKNPTLPTLPTIPSSSAETKGPNRPTPTQTADPATTAHPTKTPPVVVASSPAQTADPTVPTRPAPPVVVASPAQTADPSSLPDGTKLATVCEYILKTATSGSYPDLIMSICMGETPSEVPSPTNVELPTQTEMDTLCEHILKTSTSESHYPDIVMDICTGETSASDLLCELQCNHDELGNGEILDLINSDFDADGILNIEDSCTFIDNPDQADTDHDGRGDACDLKDDSMTSSGETPCVC